MGMPPFAFAPGSVKMAGGLQLLGQIGPPGIGGLYAQQVGMAGCVAGSQSLGDDACVWDMGEETGELRL